MTPPLDAATVRACADVCDARGANINVALSRGERIGFGREEVAYRQGAKCEAAACRDAILALLPPAPEVSHG
jgi:hypothetical protein